MTPATVLLAAGLLGVSLTACGASDHADDSLPSGITVKQQIEARQKNLKELGAAFDALNSQLMTPSPSADQIHASVLTIKSQASELANWFPAGTGPESGVKTAALPTIWADAKGFQLAARKFSDEAAKLSDVATGDDLVVVMNQSEATAHACKGCHDAFAGKN